ncbi:MFS transporter [Buchananella hordeovulneris]|uniref:MFS transporter n=1 Tax=Buchananella hordeovulneris TaxID=52770 RepID=UPI000F5F7315|nr:MFS transporter [Buchananella hordeovulneris]RRD43163.1 MFS transporter [Buchananella hordeovulneris]
MKPFLLLVGGALINALGTGMTAFALAVVMFQAHGSASLVAAVQLCGLGPIVLLAPLAGALADRYDRRTMMLLGDGGSLLGLAIVFVAAQAPQPSPLPVLVGVTLAATFASLTEPALRASVTDLLPQSRYQQAAGMLQLAGAAKFLLAPALAGLLLPTAGLAIILALDAATCLVTVACTAVVRRALANAPRPDDVPADTAQPHAWRAILATPLLRGLLLRLTLVTFAIGCLQTLFKPMLLPHFGPRVLGTLESGIALGLLLGAVALSLAPAFPPRHLLRAALALAGLAMCALGLWPALAWVAAWGLLFFLGLSGANAAAEVLVRRQVDNSVQARAWGLISLLTQSGYLLAYPLAGFLADHVLTPRLQVGGAWANTLGALFGTGPGRGAAVLVTALGLVVVLTAARRLPAASGQAPTSTHVKGQDNARSSAHC